MQYRSRNCWFYGNIVLPAGEMAMDTNYMPLVTSNRMLEQHLQIDQVWVENCIYGLKRVENLL